MREAMPRAPAQKRASSSHGSEYTSMAPPQIRPTASSLWRNSMVDGRLSVLSMAGK